MSAEIHDITEQKRTLDQLLEASRHEPLKRGGGGGTFDDMEARVKRLEDDMKEVRADMRAVRDGISDMRASLARIETDLKYKIDHKWLAIYVLGIVAVVLRSEIAQIFTQ